MMWESGWHMGWMGLWWVVLLALIVAGVWVLLKAGQPTRGVPQEETPEAILKGRYARGEIDRDEYQRRLGDLRR